MTCKKGNTNVDDLQNMIWAPVTLYNYYMFNEDCVKDFGLM
jgi:hypothetical protein